MYTKEKNTAVGFVLNQLFPYYIDIPPANRVFLG